MNICFEVLGTNSANEASYRFVGRFDNIDDAKWQAVKSLLQYKRTNVIKKTLKKQFLFFGKEKMRCEVVEQFAKP